MNIFYSKYFRIELEQHFHISLGMGMSIDDGMFVVGIALYKCTLMIEIGNDE